VVAELRRVALLAGDRGLTRAFFDQHASFHSATLTRRFGSWTAALKKAGVETVPLGRGYSEDDYFENILTVWTHLVRQPLYREMEQPPSRIPPGACEKLFRGWRRALAAFVERVSNRRPQAPMERIPRTVEADTPPPIATRQGPRTLPLALRYDILRRDRFYCVICGRTPASTPGLELHVDHIEHRSRGGSNDRGNLRLLCNECNLGRGVRRRAARGVSPPSRAQSGALAHDIRRHTCGARILCRGILSATTTRRPHTGSPVRRALQCPSSWKRAPCFPRSIIFERRLSSILNARRPRSRTFRDFPLGSRSAISSGRNFHRSSKRKRPRSSSA
jgi:5-methylcytosine-specific restriction endonuclease McrA